MLGSISLLGERARGRRWSVTVAALAVGAIGSGVALAAVLGLVGEVLPLSGRTRLVLLIAAGGTAVVADAVWLPRRIGPIRQVNDQWLAVYRGWVAGAGFGLQLGLAVATVVTSATTYVAVASMVLVGDLRRALLIGAVYGAVRGASVFLGAAIETTQDLARADRLLALTDRPARFAVVLTASAWLVMALTFWEGS